MTKQKILLLDLEVSYLKGATWTLWPKHIQWAGLEIKDLYMLSWAAKWLDEDYIYSDALFRHKGWKKDPTNDLHICRTLSEMVEEADVIVAHNGDKFDVKRLKTRFLLNGMPPPSPFQTIDTLKIARREFAFASNRLDHLGDLLGVGRKLDTQFDDWVAVVDRLDEEAFAKMLAYNEQDVLLLEEVYKILRPYDTRAFNKGARDGRPECNSCGSKKVRKHGWYYTPTGRYQKWRCTDCFHNMRSRYAEKTSKEEKQAILRSM